MITNGLTGCIIAWRPVGRERHRKILRINRRCGDEVAGFIVKSC